MVLKQPLKVTWAIQSREVKTEAIDTQTGLSLKKFILPVITPTIISMLILRTNK